MTGPGRRRRSVYGIAVAWALVSVEKPAAAQLHQSIDRVADAWRSAGAVVVVDKTRFLNEDETIPIVLPDLAPAECSTMVILGARGIGFHVRLSDAGDEDPSKRIPSEAGAVSLEVCGQPFPHRLLVTSDSGRGALETVFATSVKPLPPLRAVLPERGGGILTNAPEPGTLLPLATPEHRALASEARARRDGFEILSRTTWPSGVDGAGAGEDTLAPGCHALEIFAVDPRGAYPGRRARLDLDAEMRDAVGDRLLARDRTDAPDARLAACVGEATQVEVVFVGSPPGVPVLVAHWMQPLPPHLPMSWGSETRARMAHVLLTRHARPPPRDPVLVSQGGLGTTPVPVSLEPGGCYLAVVALVQGVARAVGVRVHVDGRQVVDERGVEDNGAAAAFCAGPQDHGLIEIEARGTPLLGWGLALFRVQAGVWEVPR